MDVQLIFTNESNAGANTRVVFFQKNSVATGQAIAWRVLTINERGSQQKLHVSQRLSVGAKEGSGLICEQHLAEYEQRWDIVSTKTRDWMILAGAASYSDSIEIRNNLPRGVITAQIYKDGRLLAEEPVVQPKQTATFHFDNTIWLGLVSDPVNEGDRFSVDTLRFVTELSLEGFSKADLILGNTGDEYRFRLQPVAHQEVLVHL